MPRSINDLKEENHMAQNSSALPEPIIPMYNSEERERGKMMTPTGQVQHLNPDALNKNPAFTNVIVVTGPVKTVYVGGQDAVDASGTIIGKGDLGAQVEQVLKNIQVALAAAGAQLE